jgi:hypothetical protein
MDEGSFDPGLTRHVVALGHDDPSPDAAIVKGGSGGSKILGQPALLGIEPIRTVECEVLGVEV